MYPKVNINVGMMLDRWYKFLTILGVPLLIWGLLLMIKSNEMHRVLWREWLINSNDVIYQQEILMNESHVIDELIKDYMNSGSQLQFNEQLQILINTNLSDQERNNAKINIENRMKNYKEIEDKVAKYDDMALQEEGDEKLALHDFDANSLIIKKYSDIGYYIFVIGLSCTAFGLTAWNLAEKKKR
jgi:hypothetical protein